MFFERVKREGCEIVAARENRHRRGLTIRKLHPQHHALIAVEKHPLVVIAQHHNRLSDYEPIAIGRYSLVVREPPMQLGVEPLGSGIEDARNTEDPRARDVVEDEPESIAISRRKTAFDRDEDTTIQIADRAIGQNLCRIPSLQKCGARRLLVEPFGAAELEVLGRIAPGQDRLAVELTASEDFAFPALIALARW